MKQEVISEGEWIQNELHTVDLGDQRLNKRMGILLEELSQHPERSVGGACSGHNEMTAAYRFWDNPKVDEQKVLAPHQEATVQRVAQCERVLAIQDTTEADYTGRQVEGAGPLSGNYSQGFYLHPLIAVTPERLCLGTLWAKLWARAPREAGQGIRETRKARPIEAKESYRWLEGYRAACQLAQECPQTQVISVADSEADIYELLSQAARAEGARAQYLIRAGQDRRTDAATGKLWATVAANPVLGTVEVEVPARGSQPARQASLRVHARRVTLRPPYRPKGHHLPPVKVWAVLAQEIDPPAGTEPVEWLLVSSLPAKGFAAAVQLLRWYAARWEIEIFFRVLKVGCQVERLQLKTDERLKPALALYMIISWRILYLTQLGRTAPELSCAAVFAPAEWQAVWLVSQGQPLPEEPPPLRQMIHFIAVLGGYKGRKGDGEPGPKVMWEGLKRVYDLALAWNTFGPGRKQATYV